MGVQISLQNYNFISSYISWNERAWWNGRFSFRFLGHLYTGFHNGRINLLRVCKSSVFLAPFPAFICVMDNSLTVDEIHIFVLLFEFPWWLVTLRISLCTSGSFVFLLVLLSSFSSSLSSSSCVFGSFGFVFALFYSSYILNRNSSSVCKYLLMLIVSFN